MKFCVWATEEVVFHFECSSPSFSLVGRYLVVDFEIFAKLPTLKMVVDDSPRFLIFLS